MTVKCKINRAQQKIVYLSKRNRINLRQSQTVDVQSCIINTLGEYSQEI